MVAVAAAFAVVAFRWFCCRSGAEGGEGFFIVEVRLVGCWGAGVVAASGARVRFAAVSRAGGYEIREEVGPVRLARRGLADEGLLPDLSGRHLCFHRRDCWLLVARLESCRSLGIGSWVGMAGECYSRCLR